MNKSKYVEKVAEEHNERRRVLAQKTLFSVIIIAVIVLAVYVGLPLLDSRATTTAVILSTMFGLIGLIFFIKFLVLNKDISDKVILKCEQEIQKKLNQGETIEIFETDITNPAFGEHTINTSTVLVGRTFILFQTLTNKGMNFEILRTDNLGDFEVHYFSQGGVGNDIGMDIKDKNEKFIRSVISQDKEQFYKFLNAMEKAKHYANYTDVEDIQAYDDQTDPFVEELKAKVKHTDKKGLTKSGILGILFGIFLAIAGSSSGVAFIYGGLLLFVTSIIFIIVLHIKK